MKGKSLSRVRLLATPWTAAYQAPPSMGFSRQEYWSGVPLPSPGAVLQGPKKKVDVLLILMAEYDYLGLVQLKFICQIQNIALVTFAPF